MAVKLGKCYRKTVIHKWRNDINRIFLLADPLWHYERSALVRLETLFSTSETRCSRSTTVCVSVSICCMMRWRDDWIPDSAAALALLLALLAPLPAECWGRREGDLKYYNGFMWSYQRMMDFLFKCRQRNSIAVPRGTPVYGSPKCRCSPRWCVRCSPQEGRSAPWSPGDIGKIIEEIKYCLWNLTDSQEVSRKHLFTLNRSPLSRAIRLIIIKLSIYHVL